MNINHRYDINSTLGRERLTNTGLLEHGFQIAMFIYVGYYFIGFSPNEHYNSFHLDSITPPTFGRAFQIRI